MGPAAAPTTLPLEAKERSKRILGFEPQEVSVVSGPTSVLRVFPHLARAIYIYIFNLGRLSLSLSLRPKFVSVYEGRHSFSDWTVCHLVHNSCMIYYSIMRFQDIQIA
jgi:hypothetical protein